MHFHSRDFLKPPSKEERRAAEYFTSRGIRNPGGITPYRIRRVTWQKVVSIAIILGTVAIVVAALEIEFVNQLPGK